MTNFASDENQLCLLSKILGFAGVSGEGWLPRGPGEKRYQQDAARYPYRQVAPVA